jgi:hypothetical protein
MVLAWQAVEGQRLVDVLFTRLSSAALTASNGFVASIATCSTGIARRTVNG